MSGTSGASEVAHDGDGSIKKSDSSFSELSNANGKAVNLGNHYFLVLMNTATPPHVDDAAILRCLGPTVNQVRAADNGANRFNVTVSGGAATFSGNVLTLSEKGLLQIAANRCSASAVNMNNLRVGK